MAKTVCPFCKEDKKATRGEGCCYCDHSGLINYGEGFTFRNEQEVLNHDPEISLIDVKLNRLQGRDDNYKLW